MSKIIINCGMIVVKKLANIDEAKCCVKGKRYLKNMHKAWDDAKLAVFTGEAGVEMASRKRAGVNALSFIDHAKDCKSCERVT